MIDAPTNEKRPHGGVRRVLLADDEDSIRFVLSFALEAEGFEVLTAADGGEAVEVAQTHQPDLILLDMMMPVMDGLAAAARLREIPETAEIPVVLLTARTADDDVWNGWRAGVDYYMTKPFDVDVLLRFLDYLVVDRLQRETVGI